MTIQILTHCKSNNSIKQMTDNDTWKSESKHLLSYLLPQLLPYLKLRWIKTYRQSVRAWGQNGYQITVERKENAKLFEFAIDSSVICFSSPVMLDSEWSNIFGYRIQRRNLWLVLQLHSSDFYCFLYKKQPSSPNIQWK